MKLNWQDAGLKKLKINTKDQEFKIEGI